MKFSVIIPVRTITDYLKESVSHLKKVKYYDFEVIIVIDEMIKVDFGRKETRFTLVASNSPNPGEKRNVGAQAATGDILAFLDDDAYPDVMWLRAAANIFEKETDLVALGGPALTPENIDFKEKMAGRLLESYLVSGNTVYRHKVGTHRVKIDDYPTVNLFVRKDAFMEVGGFDSKYWPGEDTKLCLDLVNKYGKFIYDPEPVVYHHRREVFDPYLKQISRYGKYRGWFARVFPKTSRKLSYFIPSLFILGVVFGLLTSIILPQVLPYYAMTLFLYATLVFVEAQKVSMQERNFEAFKYMFIGIVRTHYVYGTNFLKGLFMKPKLEHRVVDDTTGNYIGG